MPIKLTCQCGAKFAARSALAGKQVECMTCGQMLQVPVPQRVQQAPVQQQMPVQQMPVQQAPMQQQAPIQYQTSPVHAKSSVGKPAKWPLAITALLTTGIGIAGGILFWVMNGNIDTLKKSLEVQKTEVTAVKTVVDKTTNDVQKQAEESDEQRVELDNLEGKVADEATERNRNTTKIQGLRADAGRFRTELDTIDDKIAAEVSAKTTGFAARVTELENQRSVIQPKLEKAVTDIGKLDTAIQAADARITALKKSIVDGTLERPDVKLNTAGIQTLKDRLDAKTTSVYKTDVAEFTQFGRRMWKTIRLNSTNGSARVTHTIFNFGSIVLGRPIDLPAPPVVTTSFSEPGRFDVKLTRRRGEVYSAVLLDTRIGQVWHARLNTTTPFWIPIGSPRLHDYKQNDAWRIDVGENDLTFDRPRIFLTDTKDKQLFANQFFEGFLTSVN